MKRILFSLILTSITLALHSQHIIGIEFGYKRSSFRVDQTAGAPFEWAGRVRLGLNYQVYIGEILSTATHFKTGVAYESKGSARQSTLLDPTNGIAIRDEKIHNVLYYWTMPLMMEMHSNTGTFYLEYGGFLSYFTESYYSSLPLAKFQNLDAGYQLVSPYQPREFKKYDAGINVGFGAAFPLSAGSGMKIGLRYSYGLVNVNDDPLYTESPVYNRALVLNVSVNWGL